MTSRVQFSIGAMLTGAALLHCSTRVVLGTQDAEDGGRDAADVAVGDADVDVEVTDAAIQDEFEIPDGAVVCDAAPCAVAIAASNKFNFTGPPFDHFGSFCALLADKTIQCWGSNLQRRLGVDVDGGDGGLPMSSSPVRVEGLSDVTSVDVGGANACATIADGGVFCWGAPALVGAAVDLDGGPPLADPVLPTRQELVPSATRIAVGDETACVTTPAGKMVCWGNNQSQQLARPPGEPFVPPAEIPLGDRPVALAAPGVGITFALTNQGEMYSWGSTECVGFAQCTHRLGRDSSEAIDPIPTLVPDIGGARALALSSSHVCTIAGRFVQCWGANRNGELGRGRVGQVSELPAPTVLADVSDADDVDAGDAPRRDVPLHVAADDGRTCAAMASGRVYCWGARGPDSTGTPFRVEALSGPAVAVALAGRTSCALLRSGIVECWGSNKHGLLGRGVDDPQLEDPKPGAVHFSQ